jgi:riboflavin kinase/FMN adenylyltransferase
MDVIYGIDEVIRDTNTFVTIGTFDGLHAGHRKIVEKLKEKAGSAGGRSVVVTFAPHPRTLFRNDDPVKLLSSTDEKIELFSRAGIDVLWVINFTREFASLNSEEFVKTYLVEKLGVREIIIGHDHRFGKGRDGDENKLKQIGKVYGFEVTPVEAVKIEGVTVSSSIIRKALAEGELTLANKLLERNYSIRGTVVTGEMRGRLLGFPTANIGNIEENKLIPAIGVYAVKVIVGGREFMGVINIGKRPTFKTDDVIIPEAHIMNFSEDIYGRKIEVKFVERLRGEKKFSSKEELIRQMEADKEKSLEILS